MGNDYKQTMNLPQTAFPMRASLSTREPARLQRWNDADVYRLMLEKNEGHDTFILHDGPPYANGPIHIGHAMNKVSKDIINRFWSMRGLQTPYVPGWDCHGQPIEHKVETKLGTEKFRSTPVAEIRKLCQQYAVDNIDVQRQGFKRLGVLGEWDDPYLTFVHEYDAADIQIFKAIFDKGAIYRGRKPVHWCKHCHTALAEAEIEYGPETSPSIFVRFELNRKPAGLESYPGPVDVVIWTTTPWTLPANGAVSLKPDASYVAIDHDGRAEIVAAELAARVCDAAGWDCTLIEGFSATGEDLTGITYRHPIFDDAVGTIIHGDHVTLDDGTGAVHTAPGHGVDDYNVGCRFDIPIVMPVDDDGRFYKGEGLGSGGPFGGMDTDEANPRIIAFLEGRGALVARRDIEHSYPHCWRCKHPVIFRATDQWFVSMDATGLRAAALDAIENQVTWYPAHASKRIGSMVEGRPDWCISRQRAWGVPIPSYTCASCGEKVMNDATLDAVVALFKEKGSDAWFTDDPASYLGDACACPACGGHDLKADRDILDVWWDSGVSHTAVLGNRDNLRFPADMYLEGSDQHRGWFQSSLLTSVGAYGVPPYKSVVSQGFTLDGQGRKMSKSLGNVIDPNKVCAEMGADIVRLWVASTDTSSDVAIDQQILERTGDAYRRFRNMCRFLLSELYDFDPAADAVDIDDLVPLDAHVLALACSVHRTVTDAYESYRFNAVYRALYDFATELSNVYLDVVKDRTYCDAPKSHARRSAQTVIALLFDMFVRDLQPILVFTCDELLEHLPQTMRPDVPFAALLDWFEPPMEGEIVDKMVSSYQAVMQVRDVVTKALEDARNAKTIGKSQEAAVTVSASLPVLEQLASSGIDLAEFFIVSSVELEALPDEDAQTAAAVRVAAGEKCPRCWNIRHVGEDGLCDRCHEVIAQ